MIINQVTYTWRKVALAAVLLLSMWAVSFGVSYAQTYTANDEIQTQIQLLLAQIEQLQQRLASLQDPENDDVDSSAVEAPSLVANPAFNRNLRVGSEGPDVLALQRFLNQNRSTQVATQGLGSRGNETNYYGPATAAAVARFQEQYRSEILAPAGLRSGSGYFGPNTRAKVIALMNSANTNGGSNDERDAARITTGDLIVSIPSANRSLRQKLNITKREAISYCRQTISDYVSRVSEQYPDTVVACEWDDSEGDTYALRRQTPAEEINTDEYTSDTIQGTVAVYTSWNNPGAMRLALSEDDRKTYEVLTFDLEKDDIDENIIIDEIHIAGEVDSSYEAMEIIDDLNLIIDGTTYYSNFGRSVKDSHNFTYVFDNIDYEMTDDSQQVTVEFIAEDYGVTNLDESLFVLRTDDIVITGADSGDVQQIRGTVWSKRHTIVPPTSNGTHSDSQIGDLVVSIPSANRSITQKLNISKGDAMAYCDDNLTTFMSQYADQYPGKMMACQWSGDDGYDFGSSERMAESEDTVNESSTESDSATDTSSNDTYSNGTHSDSQIGDLVVSIPSANRSITQKLNISKGDAMAYCDDNLTTFMSQYADQYPGKVMACEWDDGEGDMYGLREKMAETEDTSGTGDETSDTNPVLQHAYSCVLKRQPDTAGYQFWEDELGSGVSAGNVLQEMFNSEEYVERNTSNETFLSDIYSCVLFRQADTDGKTFWLQVLQDGVSRGEVLNNFLNSNEFQELDVYQKVSYMPQGTVMGASVSVPLQNLKTALNDLRLLLKK